MAAVVADDVAVLAQLHVRIIDAAGSARRHVT
jgi:hypothetical protein